MMNLLLYVLFIFLNLSRLLLIFCHNCRPVIKLATKSEKQHHQQHYSACMTYESKSLHGSSLVYIHHDFVDLLFG